MESITSNPLFQELLVRIQSILDYPILGTSVKQLLIAFAILFIAILMRKHVASLILKLTRKLLSRVKKRTRDMILKIIEPPAQVMSLVIGLMIINGFVFKGGAFTDICNNVIRSLIVFSLFWALYRAITPFYNQLSQRSEIFNSSMRGFVVASSKILVFAVGTATILEIWGIKVGPILAGFGLVGAAVALGAQDLFKNLIGGIFIIAEERFKIGDRIIAPGVCEGEVENIGLRTTKIRRFDLTPIFVPNAALSENPVINNSQMKYRRINWIVGLTYSTSVDQLRVIRDEIEQFIVKCDDFAKNPTTQTFVRIDGFGDSSINLLVYCFTNTIEWESWLAVKEKLAYAIAQIVKDTGADFAFPSQSLYIESLPNDVEVFPLNGEAPKKERPKKELKGSSDALAETSKTKK